MTAFDRRRFFLGGAATVAAAGWTLSRGSPALATSAPSEAIVKIEKSASEWRELLTPEEFAVLREEGTERPYTSELLEVKEAGDFTCAGCDLPVYRTEWKYDSRTGWPSFWRAIDGHVETKTDWKLIYPRTECHCARCGGHLGHIFDDGPQPTGKRHCINGIAMDFVPDTTG